jgi:hypothetical protein
MLRNNSIISRRFVGISAFLSEIEGFAGIEGIICFLKNSSAIFI